MPRNLVFFFVTQQPNSEDDPQTSGDFSFAAAAAVLHDDCQLDATTVLLGR